ncbi:MAG: oxygen-insensitive NADPH nitroreductase [Pseudomonadales bacterium]
MNPTIDLIKNHRSIRKFKAQKLKQQQIEMLIEAGQCAATSSFIQACTVIQVEQAGTRAQLAVCAGNQAYVASAPHFLVFCADMQRHRLACDMHGQAMNSGFTEQFITATLDCGLFAQNLTLAAESMGLGCVYIGGLRNQIARVSELLALPELVYPVFGICLGYPDQAPEIKPRLPLSVVLKHERYSSERDSAEIAAYDLQVRDYYATRNSKIKQQGWSEQISTMLSKESRPHMLSYLKDRGFVQK